MSRSTTDLTTEPPPRGRPRQFDDSDVLDQLVQLFWEQGYGATSMADIVAATGLSKSSLYNTFGSKEALFEQALERYVGFRSQMLIEVLTDGTAGLDDLHSFLDLMWAEVQQGDEHRGCLAINTSTELGRTDQGVVAIAERYRSIMRSSIGSAFARAATLGEIRAESVEAYTNVFVSFAIGTAVIVRSGASNDELRSQLDAAKVIIEGWRLP